MERKYSTMFIERRIAMTARRQKKAQMSEEGNGGRRACWREGGWQHAVMEGSSSLGGALTLVHSPSCHINFNSYPDVSVIILDLLPMSLHFCIPCFYRLE